MNIEDKTLLITGAARGIGRALVEEALRRGARRVYAGTRTPLRHADARVTPLTLDVTMPAQVRGAAQAVVALDLLINNAGIAQYDDLSDPEVINRHLAVNLLGPLAMTHALLPQLQHSRGAVLNNLSLTALAPLPVIPAYSISKAAALSMTQSLRALLAGRGVKLHAALIGPTDTDMSRGFDAPKAGAAETAHGILDGLERGEEEIFPDPASGPAAAGWNAGVAKAMEREFAAFVPGATQ